MLINPVARQYLQVFRRTDIENVIVQILSDRSGNCHNVCHDE